jgi:hypothetical protein
MASVSFGFENRDGYPRSQGPGRESSTRSEEMKSIDDLCLSLFIFPKNNQIVLSGTGKRLGISSPTAESAAFAVPLHHGPLQPAGTLGSILEWLRGDLEAENLWLEQWLSRVRDD